MADQPIPPVSIEELLERAGTGDRTAFAALYDATASHAFGVALSVMGNQSQAEEVVQEAYRNVWRDSMTFDAERGSGSGWVFAMVHAAAVNSVRSSQSRSPRRADGSATPGRRPSRAGVDGNRGRSALSQVPALQRTAVELAYFEGYTHTEIATMTGMPTGAAKSRIRDGLIGLRDGAHARKRREDRLV